MNREDQKIISSEIVETAYRLLLKKLAYGGVISRNEASFRLEFGHILMSLGKMHEFTIDDKFQMEFEACITPDGGSVEKKSNNAVVDILLTYQDKASVVKTAVEMKFFKAENGREANNRYDIFRDISNLELYKMNCVDLCYLILVTDHVHYFKDPDYPPDSEDFDFREGKRYKAGTVMKYKAPNLYGSDIILENDYAFSWEETAGLYFLKVTV